MNLSPRPENDRAYIAQLVALPRIMLLPLLRPPERSPGSAAGRRLLQQLLLVVVTGVGLMLLLMFTADPAVIGWMPPRGTPSLWPVRLLTDFGKDTYLLWGLAGGLLALVLALPALHGRPQAAMLRLAIQVQYLLFTLGVSVALGGLLKWLIGRGRPFVGGRANAFNFQPMTGTEAFYSLPSNHAIVAAVLAFGIAAIWPRLRLVMIVYALVIAATRLVLLAHHPSDVVGGALVGLVVALATRYWFARQGVGFVIDSNGKILTDDGTAKGVARSGFPP